MSFMGRGRWGCLCFSSEVRGVSLRAVSVVEYKLLGNILLVTVVAFFGVALPVYAWLRRLNPESDWNTGGNVGTSIIEPLDLVVAGGYVSLWVILWKTLPETLAKAGAGEMTASAAAGSGVFLLILASVVPMVLFWRGNLLEFFGLRWKGWTKVFWIMPVFVVGAFVLNVFLMNVGWVEWVQANFNGDKQSSVKMLMETKDLGLLLAMAFSAVIAAPIAEEIIFRGYLYPVVKRFSDRWFATLFTGVLFGVVHFNLMSMPVLIVMGVALVLLYEWTGSLWVSIACHAAFNGVSVGLILLAKLKGVSIPG